MFGSTIQRKPLASSRVVASRDVDSDASSSVKGRSTFAPILCAIQDARGPRRAMRCEGRWVGGVTVEEALVWVVTEVTLSDSEGGATSGGVCLCACVRVRVRVRV